MGSGGRGSPAPVFVQSTTAHFEKTSATAARSRCIPAHSLTVAPQAPRHRQPTRGRAGLFYLLELLAQQPYLLPCLPRRHTPPELAACRTRASAGCGARHDVRPCEPRSAPPCMRRVSRRRGGSVRSAAPASYAPRLRTLMNRPVPPEAVVPRKWASHVEVRADVTRELGRIRPVHQQLHRPLAQRAALQNSQSVGRQTQSRGAIGESAAVRRQPAHWRAPARRGARAQDGRGGRRQCRARSAVRRDCPRRCSTPRSLPTVLRCRPPPDAPRRFGRERRQRRVMNG